MSSYILIKPKRTFNEPKPGKKLFIVVPITVAIAGLLDLISTQFYAPVKTAPYATTQSFAERNRNTVKTNASFLKKMQTTYPASYKMDARGTASVFFAAHSMYVLFANNSQEVQTGKEEIKDQLLYRLNEAGIYYTVTEGLGIWNIKWQEQKYLPVI